jgi:6,7-dimethyl-8-ribityllumazine synthase
MKEINGQLNAAGLRFGIVLGRFNDMIGNRLLDGALDCIERHGGTREAVTLLRVPGAFEIPLAAAKLAEGNKVDAIICLGAVIRGATPHFDFVASESAKGIAHVMLDSKLPVSYGILTTDTIEQAVERAGTKAGNKGWDAAISAIEMADLFKRLEKA